MKLKTLIAVFLLVAAALAVEKSIIHVSHIGTRTVGVTCASGVDPIASKNGDVLLISCGK